MKKKSARAACLRPGHVLDRAGAVRVQLRSTAMPLAVRPDTRYEAAPPVALRGGEAVVLLTDGVLEAHGPDEEHLFGVDRTLDLVRAHRDRPARQGRRSSGAREARRVRKSVPLGEGGNGCPTETAKPHVLYRGTRPEPRTAPPTDKERAVPLDRTKVMDYADKHWMYPCDDGFFYSYITPGGKLVVADKHKEMRKKGLLPDPDNWEPVFLPTKDGKERACFIRPNPTSGESLAVPGASFPTQYQGLFDVVPFHEDHGLVDCAHYVSRCLTAGGVKVQHSYVPDLVNQLQQLPDSVTRTLGQKVTFDQGLQILDTGVLEPGDLIAYWKYIDREKRTDYGHSAVYTGMDSGYHRITCHTIPRYQTYFFGENWSLYSPAHEKHYTFVHFMDPDDAIPPPVANALQGWFTVEQTGRKEFYQFKGDGTCVKSQKAPTARGTAGGPVEAGYWFFRGLDAIVFWPRQGQVGRFSVPGLVFGRIADTFQGLLNGLVARVKRLRL
jgi:hypothetical protein